MTEERIIGWALLDRNCKTCRFPHANIEFTFATRLGQRVEAFHLECMPTDLKSYYMKSHRTIREEVQRPLSCK